jgi:hypothetical protein
VPAHAFSGWTSVKTDFVHMLITHIPLLAIVVGGERPSRSVCS